MQTTDPYGGWAPPSDPPPAAGGSGRPPQHVLRRSRTDRVGAGVAGGLGEYFGVDPVLFRVLFATAAFFGGVGVVAYLLAWAAIPEQGRQYAAVDHWIGELRRRRVPVWCVAIVAGLIFWGIGFSWWAPRPFIPLLIIAIVVIVLMGRHERTHPDPPAEMGPPGGPGSPVDLTKRAGLAPDTGRPEWTEQTRRWLAEAKRAGQLRRRRARPVLLATLGTLVAALIGLVIADAVGGIVIPAYFWVTGGIVLMGLLVGLALRRTPWSIALLLVPALAGVLAFGNTGASFHDGVGQQDWAPTSVAQLHSDYRLAFGQATLDLTGLGALDTDRSVDVTMASGQVRILLPSTLNASVVGNVRIGEIEVDGVDVADTHGGSIRRVHGYDISHTVPPPAGATGPLLTITVHLADGQLNVRHV